MSGSVADTFYWLTGNKERILISACGSRGDVHPLIALASGLQWAGYQIKVATNLHHVVFCQSLGIDAFPVYIDTEKALDSPYLKECRAKGENVSLYTAELKKAAAAGFPDALQKKLQLIKDFVPDMLITTPSCHYEDHVISETLHIPVLQACLRCSLPSGQTSSLGEPACFPARWHLACEILATHWYVEGEKETKDQELVKQMPALYEGSKGAEPHLWPSKLIVVLRYLMHRHTTLLVGASPSLFNRSPHWHDDLQAHFCGAWLIDQSRQVGKDFGGDVTQLRLFVDDSERLNQPPVYIGWGPMVARNRQHMTRLAVRSLLKARARGIIVGGWADLSPELLKGLADTPLLEDWARHNIMFVKTAPHDWLFPRCLCIVHHGGAGTTAAALRSGVPTIITPSVSDQFDFAKVVNDTQTGVGLGQFSRVTVTELVAAIEKCNTKIIRQNAAKMGLKLMNENGVTNAVEAVGKFWHEDVKSGKYKHRLEKWQFDREALDRKSDLGCFGWLYRICWSAEPNNYRLPKREQNVVKRNLIV